MRNFFNSCQEMLGDSFEDIWPRIASSAVFLPIFIFSLISGGFILNALVMLVGMLALSELDSLFKGIVNKDKFITTIHPISLLGVFIIFIPCVCFIYIRSEPNGLCLSLWLSSVVLLTDIFAYFFGKCFGKRLLLPNISPKKTVIGSLSGLVISVLLSIAFYFFVDNISFFRFCFISFAVSLFAQIGDLAESFIKRFNGVEDSGSIIPGHGGILDRFDSFIFSVPVFLFLIF